MASVLYLLASSRRQKWEKRALDVMIERIKSSDFPEVSFQRVRGTHKSKQKAKEGAQGKETEYRLLH